MTTQPCGTAAAYHRHRKRGEEPCADCRRAHAEYARQRRASPEVRERERRQHLARMRAWSRLAAMHPTEYRALYAEELAR